MNSNTFDRVAFVFLLVTIGLLPLFFLPLTNIPVETAKGLFLVLGLGITTVAWGVARFFDGKVRLPRSLVLLSALLIIIGALLSSIFAPVPAWSLFGTMFDTGSFFFLLACFFALFLTSVFTRSQDGERAILWVSILSFLALFLFQLARLFVPEMLSLGVLEGKIGNTLGSWNAFGLLAGLGCIISLLTIEFFSSSRIGKFLSLLFFALSLFFIVAINFTLAWGLLAVFSLIIFVLKVLYYVREKQVEGSNATFPIFPLFILIFSILFLMSGPAIQSFLPTKLGVLNREIRPNFSSTMWVAKQTLKADPILGAGPGRFSEMWALHKPEKVNESQFWNVSFDFGAGTWPTFAVTLGGLGILGFLLLIIFTLKDGMGSIMNFVRSGSNVTPTIFFLSSAYLITASILYPVGATLTIITFIFIGAFVGSYSKDQVEREVRISFLEDPRKSFFAIIFLVLFVILAVVLCFKFTMRFAGTYYYTRVLNSEDIAEAETLVNKALVLNYNDLFLRARAQTYLAKLNSEVTKNPEPNEDKLAELQQIFELARDSSVLATEYNPKNYLNFQSLAALYEVAGTLGVPDSYSRALTSYEFASSLNPLNPGLKLAMARSYWFLKQPSDAKELSRQALALKPNYVEAMVFLSQIAKAEGNKTEARSYAQSALALEPENAELIQYIETLK